MTSLNDTIPLKRCTKCGEDKPATPEFFNRDAANTIGLRPDCKDCHRRITRQYVKENREKHTASSNRWRLQNLEKAKQYQKQYRKDNIEKERKRVCEWAKLNPDKHRSKAQRYEARKLGLLSTLTNEQWQACLEYFHHTCAYCGVQQSFWHVLEQEHFIPVSAGGGYTADNIVPACAHCNASKKNKQVEKWLRVKFGKKAQGILDRIQVYFERL